MADKYSTQATLEIAVPQSSVDSRDQGKKETLYFDYTVPAGDLAVAQTIALRYIPKGVRLLGGKTVNTALSSAGGTSGCSVGDGTTAAKYANALDMDAAGSDEFGNTDALYYGEYVATGFWLTLTVTGEALVDAGTIKGEVSFLRP